MPAPREFGGSFREAGPLTLVALIENAKGTLDIVQGMLSTWALHVYNLDHPTAPDTAVWKLTGQPDTVGFEVARVTGAYARQCPEGYTWSWQIGHDAADTAGIKFDAITKGMARMRVELELFDTGADLEVDGSIAAVWLLAVASRTTPASA